MPRFGYFGWALAVLSTGALWLLAGCSGAGLPASSPLSASPVSLTVAHPEALFAKPSAGQQEALFVPPSTGRAKLMFIGNSTTDDIRMFKATATGNATPVATISGSNTQLLSPSYLFVDASGTKLWVDNFAQPGGSIEAFTKPGNVAPVVDISGSNTGFNGETGIYVDPSEDIISASVSNNSISIFRAGSNGNVPPTRLIAGSSTQLNQPNEVTIGPNSPDILAASSGNNAILAFSPTANGNVAPLYEIAGSNTTLCYPVGISFDSKGLLYVSNSTFDPSCTPAILVFAAGAQGNVAPIRTITGSNALLVRPYNLRVDGLGYLYETDNSNPGSVNVFAPGANGNVAPVQSVTSVPPYANGLAIR